jgi:hypothetical protein
VVPELAQVLFEQVGTDGLEVDLDELGEPVALRVGELAFRLEEQPARVLEDGAALLGERAGLGGADLVDGLVDVGDDVESIEDVEGPGCPVADHVHKRRPHVGGDRAQLAGGGAEDVEEPVQGPLLALLAEPQQPPAALVELAHGILTFVHARVPRVKCREHGVRLVGVPWAEPGSRFTLLFEALAIAVLKEASISGAAKLLGLSWDEAHGIMHRAVEART